MFDQVSPAVLENVLAPFLTGPCFLAIPAVCKYTNKYLGKEFRHVHTFVDTHLPAFGLNIDSYHLLERFRVLFGRENGMHITAVVQPGVPFEDFNSMVLNAMEHSTLISISFAWITAGATLKLRQRCASGNLSLSLLKNPRFDKNVVICFQSAIDKKGIVPRCIRQVDSMQNIPDNSIEELIGVCKTDFNDDSRDLMLSNRYSWKAAMKSPVTSDVLLSGLEDGFILSPPAIVSPGPFHGHQCRLRNDGDKVVHVGPLLSLLRASSNKKRYNQECDDRAVKRVCE